MTTIIAWWAQNDYLGTSTIQWTGSMPNTQQHISVVRFGQQLMPYLNRGKAEPRGEYNTGTGQGDDHNSRTVKNLRLLGLGRNVVVDAAFHSRLWCRCSRVVDSCSRRAGSSWSVAGALFLLLDDCISCWSRCRGGFVRRLLLDGCFSCWSCGLLLFAIVAGFAAFAVPSAAIWKILKIC